MLPPDATRDDRILWAGLAAIVGMAHDGADATDVRKFARIEAACRTFGVSADDFDALAKRFDFHYFRPWDCYLGRDEWLEATLREAGMAPGARLH